MDREQLQAAQKPLKDRYRENAASALDEALNAVPAGDTPGRRTSVTNYQVAARMTA